MTDEQIIKGLEYCCDKDSPSCRDCPCFESPEGCVTQTDYLDLLKRQKAEIERLKGRVEATEISKQKKKIKEQFNCEKEQRYERIRRKRSD